MEAPQIGFSVRISFALSAFCVISLWSYPVPGLCDPVIDQWKALIFDGDNRSAGIHPNHQAAMECYAKAAALAKVKNLPGKFAAAFCNQTREEAHIGNIPLVDQHCDQVIELYKAAESSHSLDPELGPALLKLSDVYLGHQSNRLDCLQRALNLKWLVLAKNFPDNKELAQATFMLCNYYDDNGQPKEATLLLKKLEGASSKRLRETLNFRAIEDLNTEFATSYELDHQYDQAKKAESKALQAAGLHPGFYDVKMAYSNAFFAFNALAQNQPKESKEFFAKAIAQYKKLKDDNEKRAYAIADINQKLLKLAKGDKSNRKFALAETELKGLADAEKALAVDRKTKSLIFYLLLEVLKTENKFEEYKRLLESGVMKDTETTKADPIINAAETEWRQKLKLAIDLQSAVSPAKLDRKQINAIANSSNARNSKAQDAYLEALKLAEKFGPESNQVLITLLNLELSFIADHKLAALEPYHQQLMAITGKLRTYDDRQKLSPEIFPLVEKLTDGYEKEAKVGDPTWALGCLNRCFGVRAQIAPNDNKIPKEYFDCGVEALKQKDFKDAEECFFCQVTWLETRSGGKFGPVLITPLRNMAKAQEAQKHFAAAYRSLCRAYAIGQRAKSPQSNLATIQNDIARVGAEIKK